MRCNNSANGAPIRLPTVSDGPPDPDALARTAAQFIADRIGIAEHEVAIVLGSGWAPAVSALGQPTAISEHWFLLHLLLQGKKMLNL